MKNELEICVLAAGKGTRMKTTTPKMLQPIAGRPMIEHVVAVAKQLEPTAIHLIVGEDASPMQALFAEQTGLIWAEQREQLGTGHAVMQALPNIKADSATLILLGDVPLIRAETLAQLTVSHADIVVLTVNLEAPTGYGRITRDAQGRVTGIVEEKDATPAERDLKEVNSGLFYIGPGLLPGLLAKLTNDNRQGEFYLTDIVAHAVQQGLSVETVNVADAEEVGGVNDLAQLAAAERYFQRRQAEALMRAGVRIIDPDRIDIRGAVTFGMDVIVDVNAVIEGPCHFAGGSVIEPHCVIKQCRIGAGSVIKAHSNLEGATLAEDCQVGPYARLRPGADLRDGVSIGNFVEVKKTVMGPGSKASHLSYLGDASIGAEVNIGAGTITCNYDGVNKWQTVLEDGVFIGSNTALVAPVTVEKDATVGAGSTITGQVPRAALGVARGKQRNIEGWPRPEKITDAPGLVKKQSPIKDGA